MWIRSSALLVIVFAAACASVGRIAVPNWPRYQEGDLHGFLHAPDEQVVSKVPDVVVQRARGRVTSHVEELPLQSLGLYGEQGGVRYSPSGGYGPPDYAPIDTRMFVVELRGPDSSAEVRTVATRSGAFDFGRLPSGTYTLKATASGSAFALGWRSVVRTVILSDSVDRSTEIVVSFRTQ